MPFYKDTAENRKKGRVGDGYGKDKGKTKVIPEPSRRTPRRPRSDPNKPCPPGKIRNPATGRCVKKDGLIGRNIGRDSSYRQRRRSPPRARAPPRRRTSTPANSKSFCEEFKCDKGQTVKKCYNKRVLRGEHRHPDKGGDGQKFRILQRKYNTVQNKDMKC